MVLYGMCVVVCMCFALVCARLFDVFVCLFMMYCVMVHGLIVLFCFCVVVLVCVCVICVVVFCVCCVCDVLCDAVWLLCVFVFVGVCVCAGYFFD